jgi:hypothetical protein
MKRGDPAASAAVAGPGHRSFTRTDCWKAPLLSALASEGRGHQWRTWLSQADHSQARPSGTEDVYPLYPESFTGRDHLVRIREVVPAVIHKACQVSAMA